MTDTVSSSNLTSLYGSPDANVNVTTPSTPTDERSIDSKNFTTLYSNSTGFTSGVVNSSVYSVNGGAGISVNPTTGNVVVTNTGVLSITGTANQVIASGSTGAITLSTPQDIATTSNPTFAGATLGDITVGLASNIVIDTVANDLNIKAGGGTETVIIVGDFLNQQNDDINVSTIQKPSTANNSIVQVLALSALSTNVSPVVAGFGPSLVMVSELSNGIGYEVGSIELEGTNVTVGSESFDMNFKVKSNGVNTERMTLSSAGNLTLDGGITVSGSTSGSSTFNAPATGSTLTYTLPGTAGAASTVLTNNGSGVLSWALPGGGGSTFGNITVGVVTDNTISTTTGDLVLDSNSGTIAMNVPTITTDATTLNLFNTTATTVNFAGAATTTNVGFVASNSAVVNVPVLRLYNNISQIDGGTITTTSTASFAISSTTRQSMKVIVNITDNVTSEVHSIEAFAMKKGTNAYLTTYAELYSAAALATFSADVSGGSLRLLVTPLSANSTTSRVIKQSLT